ncbi:MAG: MotA/TolQ/ExbB proton channel family protein [Eubacteriales bacterium]|nr:MotA/TolQ/ExbB proton channel family protein [Eubacteriales bacterium]
MGKKILDKIFMVLVLIASVAFTWYVSGGIWTTMIYNFVFLGIMALLYVVGMVVGFGRMGSFERAFSRARKEIDLSFGDAADGTEEVLALPEELFQNQDLDDRYHEFTSFVKKSQSGLADIEDYINGDEMDRLIGKRMIDLIPDIFTSLGILGTFIGLVVGLKDFEPSNYEAMTTSVSALVDGIKVAFLTSIYGLSLSLVFSFGAKSAYSAMMEQLELFLDRFHGLVIPSAEAETRNILVNYQEAQTEAIQKMTDQFSEHLANSFEKVITPSFRKMNQSMDILTETLAKGQEEMMTSLVDDFLERMRTSFQMQFDDFNTALEQMTAAQKEMTGRTKELYDETASELKSAFENENANMRALVHEMGAMHKEYMTSMQQNIDNNQKYQEELARNYRQVVAYLQEAEQSSAKFWVACNQAMQQYVSAAGEGLEGFAAASSHNSRLYEENIKVVDSYNAHLKKFIESQEQASNTMQEVEKLLYHIVTTPEDEHRTDIRNLAVANSNRDLLLGIQDTLQRQGERQEQLMEELIEQMRSSKNRRGRGLFG